MDKKDITVLVAKKILEISVDLLKEPRSAEEEPIRDAYYRLKMLTDEIKTLILDKEDAMSETFESRREENMPETKPKQKQESTDKPFKIKKKKEEQPPKIEKKPEEKAEQQPKERTTGLAKNLNERMTNGQKATLSEKLKTREASQSGIRLNEKFKRGFRSLQEEMKQDVSFPLQEKVIIKNQFFRENLKDFEPFFSEIMNASEFGGVPVVIEKYAQTHNWSDKEKQKLAQAVSRKN